MKKAFTLVELMVVVGIIAILMAALSVSFASAQKKQKIAKAASEVGEITKAIRAYENYVDTGLPEMTEVEADENTLDFILGLRGTDRAGNKIPVLFNGQLTNGKLLDPWGHPYIVTVAAINMTTSPVGSSMSMGVYLPNRYGRMAIDAAQGGNQGGGNHGGGNRP